MMPGVGPRNDGRVVRPDGLQEAVETHLERHGQFRTADVLVNVETVANMNVQVRVAQGYLVTNREFRLSSKQFPMMS
jgi:hypothetical protein